MADELHYEHGGRQHGPITGAELKELAAAGKLLPDDLIWKEGMEKWVPARSAKGLFPPAPAPTTAATPNRGQEKENVDGDGAPAKVVPPARTAKSAGAAQKTPQAEQSEPLPLPDEDDDGHQPKKSGKASSSAGLWAKNLLDNGKAFWQRSRTPVKAGILGGVGVIVVLVILVPVLLLTGGGKSSSGGGSSSSDTVAGAGSSSSDTVAGGVGNSSSSAKFTRIELINMLSDNKLKDMDEFYQRYAVFLYDGNKEITMYNKDRRIFASRTVILNGHGETVNVKANHKQYAQTRVGSVGGISYKAWIDNFGTLPEVEPCYEPFTKTFYKGKMERNDLEGSTRIVCKDGSITLFILYVGESSPGKYTIALSPIIGLF